MKFLLSLLLLSILWQAHSIAQDFVQNPSDPIHLFNKEIIRENGIHRAEATYAIKYDLQKIRKTRKRALYYFDASGYVNKVIEIKPNRNSDDSTITLYLRNESGTITTKVHTDSRTSQVELFEFKKDLLVKNLFYQMNKELKWNESLYNKYLMWSDTLMYKDDRIKVYNRWKVNYKTYQLTKDSKGRITKHSTYGRSNKLEKTVSYHYENSELVEIQVTNTNRYLFNWNMTFKYTNGRLDEINYYKNNKLGYIRKISYLNNGLPELDLKRSESTKKMTIIQYEYF